MDHLSNDKFDVSSDSINSNEAFKKLSNELQVETSCCTEVPYSKTVVKYIEYVSVLKQFLIAEHTCNWQLLLLSVSEMFCLYAATGHNSYACMPGCICKLC